MRTLVYLAARLGGLLAHGRRALARFERSMRVKYKPKWLAAIALAAIFITMSITLFLPPYGGLSNDGSFDTVLADTGLARIDSDDATAYFSYYERTYLITPSSYAPGTTPAVLRAAVRLAIWVDTLFTNDNIFDMRFLAGIYMALYLAALYPLMREVLSRVRLYTEGIVIALMCVLVFGDTSIVVRFASLYTQPLELILFIVLTDCVFAMPRHKADWLPALIMGAAVILLMNVNQYCALAGIVFSLAYWQQQPRSDMLHRVGYVLLALILCFVSVANTAHMLETQTDSQKYNQMTRGVLFQATNPEDALSTFGIDSRYSILTETYADQSYPVVNPESGVLDEGFLDRYNTPDVVLYYFRHPLSLLNMFDIGVHDAFITRSDYSGNYEISAGLPARAKMLFLSAWSVFKEQSAPNTAGLVILVGIAFLVIRRKKKTGDEAEDERERSFTDLCVVLFAFSVIEMVTALVMAGDSEMVRESFLMGCFIDLLSVLFVTEILHKLKILDGE